MTRTVTLTREIEFKVIVEAHPGDDLQGWEYQVEGQPVILLEECGLANPRRSEGGPWKVEVELTKGEVDQAIDLAREP